MMQIISTKVTLKLWSVVRMRVEMNQKCSLMVHSLGQSEVRRHAHMRGVHIARTDADVNARVEKAQVVGSASTDCIPPYWICMPLVWELKTDQLICLYV